jgi:hypothetical protein
VSLRCSFELDRATVTRLFLAASVWNRSLDRLVEEAVNLLTADLDVEDLAIPTVSAVGKRGRSSTGTRRG